MLQERLTPEAAAPDEGNMLSGEAASGANSASVERFPVSRLRPNAEDSQVADNEDGRCPSWHAYFLTTYYLLLFVGLFVLALYVWSGQFKEIKWISALDQAGMATLTAVSYTVMGGAMGSILYSIRVFFGYYAGPHRRRYSSRWFGKYITAPWEGAAMAMVVASLLKGGVAAFGQPNPPAVENTFAAFGVSTLVGFSMREVVSWLQRVTRTMFGDPEVERGSRR